MIEKALTYLLILSMTILPVQVISASADTTLMQIDMKNSANKMVMDECMHDTGFDSGSKQNKKMSCCEDVSHDCQNCDNCQHVTVSVFLTELNTNKDIFTKSHDYISNHIVLSGFSTESLLRPPQSSN